MKHGLLLFHQGYTDIINCISLIHYYSEIYDKLIVIMRPEMKELTDYFSSSLTNVEVTYNKDIKDNFIHLEESYDINDKELLLHGFWDFQRKDHYKNAFRKKFGQTEKNFVKLFYTSYGIPYETRFNHFHFKRNIELENNFYKQHNQDSEEYILVHEDKERNILCDYPKDKKVIQLDKISNLFFDTIKLLENAKGIYCIDSVWSNFIYLLDIQYKVLQKRNIPIYVTCNRGYLFMYENPRLSGWNLLNTN
jgi:hypothetical protein